MTAGELIEEVKGMPPTRWVVPHLLPEGLAILVARPKIGKSWLMLNISLAVASGSKALGYFEATEDGEALYLGLEDTKRRMGSRLEMMAPHGTPSALHVAIEWAKADAGGIDDLQWYLDNHPRCRLVTIDTLAKFRPAKKSRDIYDEDYNAIAPIKKLADERGLAIVVVHHQRKAAADDMLDTVSGTNGLSGAADTLMVMERARLSADARLMVTGRDIEEGEKLLTFDKERGLWKVTGDADLSVSASVSASQTSKNILSLLSNGAKMTPSQVAAKLRLKTNTAQKSMRRMAEYGALKCVGYGTYALSVSVCPSVGPDDYARAFVRPTGIDGHTDTRTQGHREANEPMF